MIYTRREEFSADQTQKLMRLISDRTEPEEHTGCLLWKGGLDREGCARANVRSGGKTRGIGIARAVMVLAFGMPPDGIFALHSCGNMRCVSIGHLRWGTHRDNMDDRDMDGTTAKGERGGRAKMSNSEAIYANARKGLESAQDVAARLGVSAGAIYNIWSGLSWKAVVQ
jgi:hypothetical protein